MLSFFALLKHLSFLDFIYLYFNVILSYVLPIYLCVLHLFHVLLAPLCPLTFNLYVLLFSLPGVFENRSLFQYNIFFYYNLLSKQMYANFCVLVRNLFGLVEFLYITYSSQSILMWNNQIFLDVPGDLCDGCPWSLDQPADLRNVSSSL